MPGAPATEFMEIWLFTETATEGLLGLLICQAHILQIRSGLKLSAPTDRMNNALFCRSNPSLWGEAELSNFFEC